MVTTMTLGIWRILLLGQCERVLVDSLENLSDRAFFSVVGKRETPYRNSSHTVVLGPRP